MKTNFLAGIVLAIVAVGCGPAPTGLKSTGLGSIGGNKGLPSGPNGQTGPAYTDKYELAVIKDGADDACIYTVPAGWSKEGTLKWIAAGVPYPLISALTYSPDRTKSMGWVPMLSFKWDKGPMGEQGVRFGGGLDVVNWIFSQNKEVSNFQIIDQQIQPAQSQFPGGIVQNSTQKAETAAVRATWTEKGVEKEGLIVCKIDISDMAFEYGQSQLSSVSLLMYATPKGQLMNADFIRWGTMFFKSLQIPPSYARKIGQAAFDASQENRKIALQQNDDIMKRYWDQQRSNEHRADQFDQYIRGVTEQSGPDGRKYIVPNNGQNWVGPGGQIINSTDPNFDPNNDPNGGGGNWSQLSG